jgi:type II secretory pathway pseudopilin PulG
MEIIAILLSIAVPTYLGFRDKAQKVAAASDVREAIPAIEVSTSLKLFGSSTGYCVSEANHTHKAKLVGLGGTVQTDPAVAALCTSAAG